LRTTRIVGHLDLHRPFVDNDHEENLRRIGNRGEPLQHLHALEPLRGAQTRSHIVDGRWFEASADFDAREATDLVVGRGRVSVYLDCHDRFGRRLEHAEHQDRRDECRYSALHNDVARRLQPSERFTP
jgi:hypothetical protein